MGRGEKGEERGSGRAKKGKEGELGGRWMMGKELVGGGFKEWMWKGIDRVRREG